jgi:hypothetical protein
LGIGSLVGLELGCCLFAFISFAGGCCAGFYNGAFFDVQGPIYLLFLFEILSIIIFDTA